MRARSLNAILVSGLLIAIIASVSPLKGCASAAAGGAVTNGGTGPLRPAENSPRASERSADTPERAKARPSGTQPVTLEPFEDIVVHLREPAVEVRAWVCLDAGFLEQIACSPGTREHESLVVIRARPSNIHAAILLAGFEPGSPGRWLWNDDKPEGEQLRLIQPEGDLLDVFVRYERDDETIEEPIRNWVRDYHDMDRKLPDRPWVFGGSLFRQNPQHMDPGEHYVADFTGSIIGLVTFGDEVVGFKEVISDQAAIHEPEWEVDIERIPPMGTEVTIILRGR